MLRAKERTPIFFFFQYLVVEPTHTLDILPKTSMEEQKDYEKQDDHDDHESEKEQPTTILFTLEQLW